MVTSRQSEEILKWCIKSVVCLIYDMTSRGLAILAKDELKIFLAKEYNGDVTSQQISKMIYDLRRREYVESFAGDSVILTNKAKIKIIDRVVGGSQIDGKLRLVSFDIPENMRLCRDNFRRAIKRMGFKQVQKSLWAANRNVGALVEVVAEEYGVSDYVAYFVSDISNIDSHISNTLNN
jgi:DNA-binding transcriptional regulator PaaX